MQPLGDSLINLIVGDAEGSDFLMAFWYKKTFTLHHHFHSNFANTKHVNSTSEHSNQLNFYTNYLTTML